MRFQSKNLYDACEKESFFRTNRRNLKDANKRNCVKMAELKAKKPRKVTETEWKLT